MPFHPFSGICVLLALAIPLFSSPLARSNIRPLPATSIADAVELVQFARTGYCNETVIKGWSCGDACASVAPVKFVKLGGDGKSAPNWHIVYWPRKEAIVVVHEGTSVDSLHSIMVDLRLSQVPFNPSDFPGVPGDVLVHKGFLSAQQKSANAILSSVNDLLNHGVSIQTLTINGTLVTETHKPKQIYVTGYSLGAAVAILNAIHLQLHLKSSGVPVSTFQVGTPMAGNPAFAAWADQILKSNIRAVNKHDIIPRLPDLTGADWEQCGVEWHVDENNQWWDCGTVQNYGEDSHCSKGFSRLGAHVTDHWALGNLTMVDACVRS